MFTNSIKSFGKLTFMASFYFGKTLMSISATFSVIRKTKVVLLFNKKTW